MTFGIPGTVGELQHVTQPNLPWAEDHFQERVSGIPHNPPPSHVDWPWARHNSDHQDNNKQFSHTYPERFWPRHAPMFDAVDTNGKADRFGIRFRYGDLGDVVNLLNRNPLTRQAYLPVWFPEDTGAVEGQRVPCTLGYHFMIRNNQLSCMYPMRSCDVVRHLRDDIYLAARLMQWIVARLSLMGHDHVTPGTLTMNIASLHAFVGDTWKLERIARGDLSE